MSLIYFVRHAHSSWTPDEMRPLSPQGFDAALSLADFLEGYPIDSLYTSPYSRASQTVEPLAERLGLSMTIEPDLRERHLGDGPFGDHLETVAAVWENPAFAYPGGESNHAAQARGVAVIERLRKSHRGEHIVAATHGNIMALMLQHYQPAVDYEFWKALSNPDIYTLDFTESERGVLKRLWENDD